MITSRTAALATPVRSLRYGQLKTIVLLFGGYAACYYCRADLSVATPLLVEELGRYGVGHGEALVRIGSMTSLGVLAYALGKLFLTGLGDYWGGRRNFLIGVGGAMLFTLCFAAGGGVPVFTLAWVGNRLTQSVGWAGLIKVSSKWFDYSSYGSIIGILSISYLVGDAAARQRSSRQSGWLRAFCSCASRAPPKGTRRRRLTPSTCLPPRNRGRRARVRCSCRCCAAARSSSFVRCLSRAR